MKQSLVFPYQSSNSPGLALLTHEATVYYKLVTSPIYYRLQVGRHQQADTNLLKLQILNHTHQDLFVSNQ